MVRLKTQAEKDQEHTETEQKLTGNYPLPTHRMALLYSRYSSAKQVVASIAKGLEQSNGLIQRALDLGWKRELTTLFIENSMTKNGRIRSVSGTIPIEDRAGISTVIEHVKLGAGAILCDDISRLTRDADLVDATTLARTCKEHDCEIITNDRRYNFKRQADYDAYIKEAQEAAAFLEHHIKGKMLKNRRLKAEQGKVANGVAPIGLMLDKNDIEGSTAKHGFNLQPSPHASGVAWLYQRFVELETSKNGVLRECNAMAQQGKPLFPVHPDIDPKTVFLSKVYNGDTLIGWTVGSRAGLTDILTNPAYIGHLVFNGSIVKRNAHPAIVNIDLWQYVFDHLSPTDLEHRPIEHATKTVRYSYPESQQTALLSGVRDNGLPVIDGVNGLHVYVQLPENSYVLKGSRGNTVTHGYETSIRVNDLDYIIKIRLLTLLELSHSPSFEDRDNYSIHGVKAPNWYEEMIDYDKVKPETTTVPDDTLESIDAEIALAQQDLDISKHVMDVATRTGLYAKIARLSRRRDKLQQAEDNKAKMQRKREQAKKDVEYASGRWASWDLERQRGFIHLVTEYITLEEIAPGWLRIVVQWSYVLDGLQDTYYLWRVSGTLWSKQEVKILQKHYPNATRVKLLSMLPTRSWTAISRKAALKGIRRIAKSDPIAIPDTTSWSDQEVFTMLKGLLTETELHIAQIPTTDLDPGEGYMWEPQQVPIDQSGKRLFQHTTQPSQSDMGTRPGDSMVESPRHGQFSPRLYPPTSRD
jgi:DNA invertase Pin-like site-specific DNA recombinase